jgi:lipoprotein-releasing system permease protein
MNLPYQIFIALRYLKSKKRYKGVSVNTAISIGGVAVGVMALLVVLAVMTGFQQDLQKKILGANAHIIVRSFSGSIAGYETISEQLRREKDVTSFAPFVLGQVLVSSGHRAHGVFLKGINPAAESKTTEILSHIKDGNIRSLDEGEGMPGIILGRELAGNLGVFIGDTVNVISPTAEIGPMGMLPRVKQFRVVAIFEIGMFEYDSNLVLTGIGAAQNFLGFKKEISGVEIRLDDIYKAPGVRKRLRSDSSCSLVQYYQQSHYECHRKKQGDSDNEGYRRHKQRDHDDLHAARAAYRADRDRHRRSRRISSWVYP